MAWDAKNIKTTNPKLGLNKVRRLRQQVRFLKQNHGSTLMRNPGAQVLTPRGDIGTDHMQISPSTRRPQID